MTRILVLVMVAILAGAGGWAQSGRERPEFDAVAIRLSPADARGGGFNLSPGRLAGKNVTLADLVEFAYELHDYQLSGASGWMNTEHYEVTATFPVGAFPGYTGDGARDVMLQTMLADRFGLVVHREAKETTGYALTVGKSGSKLKAATSGERGMLLGRSAASGLRSLNGNTASTAQLASILADVLGRPVEDRTGLAGVFDFSVEWTPDATSERMVPGKAGNPEAPGFNQAGPSIFTALQDTLGLRLETRRVAVEGVVIDHAEKPTAN